MEYERVLKTCLYQNVPRLRGTLDLRGAYTDRRLGILVSPILTVIPSRTDVSAMYILRCDWR